MLIQNKLKSVIFCIKDKSEFNNSLKLRQKAPGVEYVYVENTGELLDLTDKRGDSLFICDDKELLLTAKSYGFLCVPTMGAEADYGFEYVVDNLEDNTQETLEGIFLRLSGQPWIMAETRRCRIREITVQDVPALYDMYEDERVTAFTDRLYEKSEDEMVYTKEYIRTYYRFYEYGMWIVEDKISGEVIGRAGLEPLEDRVELGYVIAGPLHHMGYGMEVCEAVMKLAGEILPEEPIFARCHMENVASLKILKNLGFEEVDTGINQDLEDDVGMFVRKAK